MRLSLILVAVLCCTQAQADGLRFGLLAKSTSDHNFVDAWQGCQQAAAADGNQCDLLGADGPANAHVQWVELEKALGSGEYASIAISVTASAFLARHVGSVEIPLLTFDSPFDASDQGLSEGYIGPDNYAFGKQLAELALSYRPDGGVLCIVSVGQDPNLETRVRAVRKTLAGDEPLKNMGKLNGEGGWHEHERCPRMTLGSPEQVDTQFRSILTDIQPHVIISVGHWPVVDAMLYRRIVRDIQEQLINHRIMLFVGVGQISPAYRALLDEGLVHGLVSIDFTEIGRVTYEQMKQAAAGQEIPRVTHTQKRLVYPEWLVDNSVSRPD